MKWILGRVATYGLYILAVLGISGWDRDPDSWILIGMRLGAAAILLWWAVARTVGHWREDHIEEKREAREKK